MDRIWSVTEGDIFFILTVHFFVQTDVCVYYFVTVLSFAFVAAGVALITV